MPANHPARVQIDHDRTVYPTLQGPDVGDVGRQREPFLRKAPKGHSKGAGLFIGFCSCKTELPYVLYL